MLKLRPLAGNAISSLRITTTNIDDAIMWKTYQILVRKRRDAVDKLRSLVEDDETEPPPASGIWRRTKRSARSPSRVDPLTE